MKVWFPEFYMECQRDDSHREEIVREFLKHGVECVDNDHTDISDCDLIFCGTFPTYHEVRKRRPRFPTIPAIFYCWDLYPFQFRGTTSEGKPTLQSCWWLEYVEEMRKACLVLVPSQCTVNRVHEIGGKNINCKVVPSIVYPWDGEAFDGDYVMGVMREYQDEPNLYLIKESCLKLGIPFSDHKHRLSWEDYQKSILGARVLISPYFEASTGGLSLLEGLWNGKHSLVARSPRNGVCDYLQDKATYFDYDNRQEFEEKLVELYNHPITHDVAECGQWIKSRYSTEVVVEQLVAHFRSVL